MVSRNPITQSKKDSHSIVHQKWLKDYGGGFLTGFKHMMRFCPDNPKSIKLILDGRITHLRKYVMPC